MTVGAPFSMNVRPSQAALIASALESYLAGYEPMECERKLLPAYISMMKSLLEAIDGKVRTKRTGYAPTPKARVGADDSH